MKRLLLASCATALAMTVTAGSGALAQTTFSSSGTQDPTKPITDGATPNSVTVTNGATYVLDGVNTYTGGTTVNGNATASVGSDNNLGAASGGLTLGDGSNYGQLTTTSPVFTTNRAITLNAGGGSVNAGTGTANLQGVISGAGALTVNGGIVNISNAANTYTGGTNVIGGGTLQVATDSAMGNTLVGSVLLGDTTHPGTLQWVNTGDVSSSRAVSLGIGGGIIITSSAGTVTLNGNVSGYGPLTVAGNGRLLLANASLFNNTQNNATTGIYVLSGATLEVNSDSALGGYTQGQNQTTGQLVLTPRTDPQAVALQGGTLQFGANTTVLHPITLTDTSAGGSTGSSKIDTQGNTDTIASTAPISGSGGLTKLGSGTLILDGVNTYTGRTDIAAGTLKVGDSATNTASITGQVLVETGGTLTGAGTVIGTVTNGNSTVAGGTVAPSDRLTVVNYVQNSGTLAPMITPGSTRYSSQLVVTGNTTIYGGTLSASYGPGFLRPGVYQILTTRSPIHGGFATIKPGTLQTVGLTAAIVPDDSGYELVLTQVAKLPDNPTVIPVMTSLVIDQAQRAIGGILDRLTGVRTNAVADELAVALTDSHKVRGASPYGFWFQPLGDMNKQTGNNGAPGYKSTGGGMVVGADTEWARGVSIGAALGLTETAATLTDGTKGRLALPQLSLYGGWWSGIFALDAVVGAGLGKVNSVRPAFGQVAKADHVANEKFAAVQASAAIPFDGWVIGPAAGAKFLNLRQTSFTEKGTTVYDFTFASDQTNSLRPYADVDLTRRFMVSDHWALVPDVKIGVEHEVFDTQRHVLAQTQGDITLFTVNGLTPGADRVRVNGGLQLETSRDQAFYVNYDALQGTGLNSQFITGGFRYRL